MLKHFAHVRFLHVQNLVEDRVSNKALLIFMYAVF